MKSRLSGRYNFSELCRFAWPTIIMLVFMSLYTMVDGAFVSNLLGTTALSAVNLVAPIISFYCAVGIMLAIGSTAIVARKLGQGLDREARSNFTFIILVAVLAGLLVTVVGLLFLDPILRFLGAGPEVIDLCREYARTLLYFVPVAVLQLMFQSYFVAAGKPGYGLLAVLLGGIANVVLDYVFIAVMDMGIAGAALATGIGYSLPALSGLLYFSLVKGNRLRFGRPTIDLGVVAHSCGNGSSEMVSNLSIGVTTYLFNRIMMAHLGVDGVAAITIILYAEWLFSSIFMGFATGVAPLFSYKYGKGDDSQLRKLFRNSMLFIGSCSLVAIVVSLALAGHIVGIFTPPDSDVFAYALDGFRLHAFCFLFMGFNIFASALFTALSNGKISALLSFLRTFVFLVGALLILPHFMGAYGAWLAVPVAEGTAILVSALCIGRLRRTYGYA